jgi:sterol desaturase/sphingolipid hydroxylase (fatty acid hydroxylase superfamily)
MSQQPRIWNYSLKPNRSFQHYIPFFLLLSIFLHRKQLSTVLTKCFPSSLPFNYASYCFDVFITLPGLLILYQALIEFVRTHQLHLLPPAFYEDIPIYITGLLAVFVGDLIGYFRHRIEHSRFLWPTHAMHHSDASMTWFTLFRFHPLNRLTTFTIDSSVLLLCGFPLWALVFNGLVRHYYGMFIHANVPWDYGKWLGRVFVSPAMHRWHHVLEGQGIHSNYATVFSIFDQLFKTYYVPGPCAAALGVKELRGNSPISYLLQLIYPFKSCYAYLSRQLRKYSTIA